MKRLFTIFIFAILFGGSAFAYDFSAVCESGQTLYYNITSDTVSSTVKVTYENASSPYYSTYPTGELEIPESVEYNSIVYSVTSIGESAFSGCSGLTSVLIPNSVTSIGNSAFYGCSGLTSAIIGNSVPNIGNSAFYGCSGLTAAYYTGSIEQWCELSFGNGYANPLLYAHNLYVNNNLVTDLVIPNTITEIKQYVFYGASCLTSIDIPIGVTSIGNYAFYNCSGLTGELTMPNSVTSIGDGAFLGCSGLTGELTIPNSVISIGGSAFQNCSGLTGELTIPDSVASIGGSTFRDCSGLTSVTIPNSVTSIGYYAFSGCSGMTSVTVPNSVTSIGKGAFKGCSGLVDMTIPFVGGSATATTASASTLFGYIFGDTSYEGGTPVTQHDGTTHQEYQGLFIPVDVENDYTYYIPSSLRSVSITGGRLLYGAFYGCLMLTSVTIGNLVTSIGYYAFYGCSGLTTVNFNATNCTSIGSSVWSLCSSLSTLTIGENVRYIPYSAFSGCSGLTGALTIPNSVTSIGNSAFSGCIGLTSLTVGNSVENIGSSAFYNCSGLTGALTIPNSVTSIGDAAFSGCSGLTGTLTIPNSITSIGNQAFFGCNGLTTLNFNAENCTGTINNWFNTNNLTKITIGENVTTIPNNAFKNCISLDSIISYASNPPVIYASTFDSNLSLNIPVVVPCGTVEAYEEADFWYNFRRIQQSVICPTTYTITVLSNNSTFGAVSGGGEYLENSTATLTATPAASYRFVNWSDGSTENPHYVVVTSDATYIATFVLETIPSIYSEVTASVCGNYTWNDITYTESGDHIQTFTAMNSADSIVTLHLTIYPLPQPEITVDGILDACNPETTSVTLSAGEYNEYNWSNGETTNSIVVTSPGNYYVEVVDEHGCHGYSDETSVGYSTVLTDAPQIKGIGTSRSGGNVIEWSVNSTEGIAGFEIYREGNVANTYTCVKHIDRPGVRSCIDQTANPSARAYRYKVCAIDECGGMSPMSEPHKTMHLTINRGIGDNWNLIWSHYEGMDFPSYKIYRGTSIQDMIVIGEVSSNLNSFTDSDNPNNTGFFYQVVVVRNSGAKDGENENSLRSNVVDNGFFPEHTIMAVASNPSQGMVSGGGTYPEGYLVTLTAEAFDGYAFVSWNDGNTDNPREITVTSDAIYMASFSEISHVTNYTITVVSANPNHGTVAGGGTYPEGSVIFIEANANEGYEFASWDDGNTDNPREITVTSDAIYLASFSEISHVTNYTITVVSANPNHG
ncbi:MAG: leucine-rich repeat domain-containing protein, partial [Bacteroidales bacterium]|nr:leucine-rich repeat domain-containing protein [Bacteroidales bacterium]